LLIAHRVAGEHGLPGLVGRLVEPGTRRAQSGLGPGQTELEGAGRAPAVPAGDARALAADLTDVVEGAAGGTDAGDREHLRRVGQGRVPVEGLVHVGLTAADEGALVRDEDTVELDVVRARGAHPGDVPVLDDLGLVREDHRVARPRVAGVLQTDPEDVRAGGTAGELPPTGAAE